MNYRIGSRESTLAIAQAQTLCRTLEHAGHQTTLVTMKTTGDRILDRTLDKIGGKGLFIKELEHALVEKRVDFTVHSLKDMPMTLDDSLPIVAVSAREDARDVLVLPSGSTQLDPSKPIGCASARRRVQLRALFPEMDIQPVRGNVQTRLEKLDAGEYSALVLAAAGLHRLELPSRIHRYFTVEEILPAAGQAAIAVQAHVDTDTTALHAYHDAVVWQCVLAERAFARALGGGCSAPVGAYATLDGDTLTLRGMVASADEKTLHKGDICGAVADAEALGRALAAQLGARI